MSENPPGGRKRHGWQLARDGIDLVLNNRIDEAEKLFKSNSDDIQMAAGYSFLTFMNALMSYEEEKLTLALVTLRATERRCTMESGWFRVMRNRMFGADKPNSLAASLEEQIILADTQVCIAILTFLQQEFSGYVKGSWVLRKAWKVYQNVYNQILELYLQHSDRNGVDELSSEASYGPVKGINTLAPVTPSKPMVSSKSLHTLNLGESPRFTPLASGSNVALNGCVKQSATKSSNSQPRMTHSASGSSLSFSSITHSLSYPFGLLSGIFQAPNTTTTASQGEFQQVANSDIPFEEITRLMAAVSFGYGVFQLSVSMLPPPLLKLTQLFGFGADRKAGLDSLMYARRGEDMRAPLATLALLWYHTIVRSFFALDGCNLQAGVNTAVKLMDEVRTKYGQSALFLFFEGRISRLESNIPKALESYQAAVDNSTQREIKLLCLHEVGWCYLIRLDYPQANSTFTLLKQRSRWSRSFYAYLSIICAGACCILTELTTIDELRAMLTATIQKESQIDDYLNRRLKHFPDEDSKLQQCDINYWKMYTYELLYLWNALPSCSHDKIDKIVEDCENYAASEPMIGLAYLVSGFCYYILGNVPSAIKSFKNCLAERKRSGVTEDCHIAAFAQFELAVILLKNAESYEEGKDLLQKIQTEYKDYDFEHRLNVRIHAALKRLM